MRCSAFTAQFRLSRALNERIHEIASKCFFGIDINPDLVKATKMNMVMNNDGSGNIFRQDILLHPHQVAMRRFLSLSVLC